MSRSLVHPGRVEPLRAGEVGAGPVVYWMSRDQRVEDNWALLYARELALARRAPLGVVFCLAPTFLDATRRAYEFMLRGLRDVEQALRDRQIGFWLLTGTADQALPAFLVQRRAAALVCDFDPLRVKREWREQVARRVAIPMFEVDAHNIVPCRRASPKQEFGAYTFRPKLRRLLAEYLTPFPRLPKHPYPWPGSAAGAPAEWEAAHRTLRAAPAGELNPRFPPGAREGRRRLRDFIGSTLAVYARTSNDPTADSQSGLSPYLHFGQVSAQRVALDVDAAAAPPDAKAAFLEQLIVRRELSDNYCFYNPAYDRLDGAPAWARKTLAEHWHDPRPRLYTPERLEHADTHDPLWNAAQRDLVTEGKLHGYLRMYWAKKILEWTASPEEAFAAALHLNDKYELDGRDPNGYVGVAWSIGGVHDRAWGERPIFGKIRYMSLGGCRTKFKVNQYIERVSAGGRVDRT